MNTDRFYDYLPSVVARRESWKIWDVYQYLTLIKNWQYCKAQELICDALGWQDWEFEEFYNDVTS